MMRRGFIISLMLSTQLLYLIPARAQDFIAGHTVAKEEVLRKIPRSFIDKAREELVIAYQHTSHGTHVSRGMYGLQDYKTGDTLLFGISSTPDSGRLEFRDYALENYAPPGVTAIDLSVDERAFIQTTINYLDAPENATVNVVMWSWCNIAGHLPGVNYLPGMDSLIANYGPGGSKIGTDVGQREIPVTFIYMTGHANVDANTGPLNPMEQARMIVDTSRNREQFCLDYYSIDTHDMDDNYYEDAGDDGNSVTYGGNFYHDWQNSHVLGVDYYENKFLPGGAVVFGEHNTQHITANRKAFAMWWILARIAGWDGNYLVTDIQVAAEGDTAQITTSGGILQLQAVVTPFNATDTTVTWSVINGTGSASIDSLGIVTALSNGTITARATANDSSGVYGELQITITNQLLPVTEIWVSGQDGCSLITTIGGTLQLHAAIRPENATDTTVRWSLILDTVSASIDSLGLVTAISNDTITARATANDSSGTFGELVIIINDQLIPATEVSVQAADTSSLITTFRGTLQLQAVITPLEATDSTVTWTVINGTGRASVDPSGLISALANGTVTARATANDGSGVYGEHVITISNQILPVSEISVIGADSSSQITTDGGTLQLQAVISPFGATDTIVIWSVAGGTGSAKIDSLGLVTALSNGTVTARAMANDTSGVYGELVITITNQVVLVSEISVIGADSSSLIATYGGTLQLQVFITPSDATDTTVTWSVLNGTGSGNIDSLGLVTALSNGTVTARATSNDTSGVFGELMITITNQPVPVSDIKVSGEGGSSHIPIVGETLQLYAVVTPADATDTTIGWSLIQETGSASIDSLGLVTALSPGTVTARATANDSSGIFGELPILIGIKDTLDIWIDPSSSIEIFSNISTMSNRRAMPVTMPESGDIQSITIYHEAGGGGLVMGVYADASGLPGQRLGVTNNATVSSLAGWQSVNLSTPASVGVGETIWLAWVFESNPGIRYQPGTPGRAQSPEVWGGGMPEAFGTSAQSTSIYSIYCSYTPSGVAGSAPDAPTNLSSSEATAYSITLLWNDNSNNETGFEIERSDTSGSGYSNINTSPGNITSYMDVAVEPEHTYFYRIRSINSYGESEYTTELSVSTPAEPVGGRSIGYEEVYEITSTMAARRAMPVTMPESGDIQSITIYHEAGGGGLVMGIYADASGLPGQRLGVTNSVTVSSQAGWQTVNLSAPASVGVGETIWLAWVFESNPGIRYRTGTPGRAQSPEIWAGGMPDQFGTSSQSSSIYSIYCNYTTSGVAGTAPDPPTDLSSNEATAYSITLLWNDNSSNETGFEIERSDTSGSGYTSIYTSPGNTTSYVDIAVEPEHTYFYRIRSTNLYGESDYTTELSVTTPAEPVGGRSIGYEEVYDRTSTMAARRAMPVTMTESGDIQSITIYHEAGSGGLIMGVYADASGLPGERLGVTNSVTVSSLAGWQTVNLNAPASVEVGTTIWLAWVFESNPGVRYQPGTPGRAQSPDVWAGGMPLAFGTSTQSSSIYSIYCNYTSSGVVGSAPVPPTNLSSSEATASSITLLWNDNSTNETGFEIERSETLGSGYANIHTSPGNTTSYVDLAVEPEHTYFYRIRAINSYGESDYTAEVSVTTPAEPVGDSAPDPPTDLSSSEATASSITLLWNDNSTNETGFEIERSDTLGSGYANIHTSPGNTTSYVDLAVEPEHTYFYRIRSINSYGESDYTPVLSVSTPAEPAGGGSIGYEEVYDRTSTMDLRRAMPVTMTEAGDIQSITIYHEAGSGGLMMGVYADASGLPGQRLGVSNSATVSSLAGWQTVHLNAPAQAGAGETIWLAWVFESNPGIRYQPGTPGRAQSLEGWGGGMPPAFGTSTQSTSNYSIYCSYTPSGVAGSAPAPPTDLSSFESTAYNITLLWNDNSTNETGFEIQRSDTPGSGFSTIYTSPGNTTSYMDIAVEPEHTYFYRIRSINSYGESDYTTELSVSTPAEPAGGRSIGHTEVYETTSTMDARRAMPVTMPESGDIQSITIYHEAGSGGLIMGVYADASGLPGQRLGVTNSATVSSLAGWQTVDLSVPASVNAGESIWLAWVFENNPGIRYEPGTPGRAQSPDEWGGGMPAAFGASAQSDYTYSIYANYISSPSYAYLNMTLGEEELESTEEEVNTYPNPSTGELTISWKGIYSNGLLLEVYNSTGRMVKNMEIEPNMPLTQINIGEFHQGIYFIVLTDVENKVIINRSKVIKLH